MEVVVSQMSQRQVDAGLRLSAQNGWNQLEADWRRQLDLEPDACFVAEAAGQVVGAACACVFETVAWVNLVLVDQVWRGRGIGTRLMRTVLDHLDARGIPSIRLDATPLGQPIYEKLGFTAEYTLTRFGGIMPGHTDVEGKTERSGHGVRPRVGEGGRERGGERTGVAIADIAGPDDLPGIIALDRAVTSTARGKLFAYVMKRQPDAFHVVREAEAIIAYAGCRPGARAWQIGPCASGGKSPTYHVMETEACMRLLNTVGNHLAGKPAFIDVPNDNPSASAWAAATGLAPQRTLTRMGRGPRVREQLKRLWASFGPEKG
jgi:GNAT superfamily N-acetyltransferase